MQLVYSSLRNCANGNHKKKSTSVKRKTSLRYLGYQAACEKYQSEIAAIQQYIPNWKPAFK